MHIPPGGSYKDFAPTEQVAGSNPPKVQTNAAPTRPQ
jgi:hypothetical protein